jgi:rare lipoprotein A
VKINDRGPFVGERAIDLSEGAARKIAMIDDGVAKVELTIIT